MSINKKLYRKIDIIWRIIGGVLLLVFLSNTLIDNYSLFLISTFCIIGYILISLVVLGYFKIIKLFRKIKKK